MTVKIAAIADTHFAYHDEGSDRRSRIADILLLRAVHRLNRFIKPDITLILGDLIEDGGRPDAAECLRRVREVVDLIESPTIVIPGNHDGDPAAFYRVFEDPGDFVDVKGVRFVPFVDPEEADFNARRTARNLERMAEARAAFEGQIVAVQHVPVFPPGQSDCPYNYTNAEEVIAAMRAHGVGLAVSGHYHAGMDLPRAEGMRFTAAPALCKAPFPFLTITLGGDGVEVRRHELRMPDHLGLVDPHVHTQLAYCSENMEMARAMALAGEFGLAGMAFAEHSGQLYFTQDAYWRGDWFGAGIEGARKADRRMDAYLALARQAGCPPGSVGLEADCLLDGRPLVRHADRAKVGFLIGAIHRLPELMKRRPDRAGAAEEFLGTLERFLSSGIRVLAHPFRVFRRAGLEPGPALFGATARLLRQNGVAAEVNFHHNEPPPEFVRLCLESGVKLTFGSDAHNLCEIGEFAPHLGLLRSCGFDGDLEDILLDPREGARTP